MLFVLILFYPTSLSISLATYLSIYISIRKISQLGFALKTPGPELQASKRERYGAAGGGRFQLGVLWGPSLDMFFVHTNVCMCLCIYI